MIITKAPPAPTNPLPRIDAVRSVGGPVWVAWRESTLTRAYELETLTDYLSQASSRDVDAALSKAIKCHLSAARDAASGKKPELGKRIRLSRNGPLLERAMSNLDAAEAQLLNLAPTEYLAGQLPSLLRHVQRHLRSTDPGRQEFERLVKNLSGDRESSLNKVEAARDQIVATVRAASSAALRENIRLRSFRNIVVSTTLFLSLLVVVLAVIGLRNPTLIPMCFAPQGVSEQSVVCPTNASAPFVPLRAGEPGNGVDIDDVVADTAKRTDIIVVELIGLVAAAIAAAAAISHVRGSSERYGIPVALAALKLPTGALTAFLGLLLMRGQFVPGLNALDTSAQILAWGLVFGYAQQLFTRFIDQQGQTVLNSVRGADTVPPPQVRKAET
ncbi:hypothetical protein HGA11_26975 [Mycolicibacterium septicum DSM 44393]|uniref:Uncharacterized protein n=1 Tax=Mycolicibacterium septicum DSM 44393 TaxID=1341646 RepID=A0A7X6RYL5_9MYCO|nr:hypothetical protein [Mycolicibacterium septicum]NKZ14634.1 hypothetical protein [Mycolicibacterium septicum DSM 44393]